MKFATCLNCIDGRVQLPVIHWIKENYDIDYVDMITEAGMDGILTEENYSNMKHLMNKIDISLTKHNSNMIFVAGHYDCATNPVNKETHKRQIHTAVKKIKSLYLPEQVMGLYVTDKWEVENINIDEF